MFAMNGTMEEQPFCAPGRFARCVAHGNGMRDARKS